MEEDIHGKRKIVDTAENEKLVRKLGDDRDRHLRDEKVEDGTNTALLNTLVLPLVCFLEKITGKLIELRRVLENPRGAPTVRLEHSADDAKINRFVLDLGRDPPLQMARDRRADISDHRRKFLCNFLNIRAIIPRGNIEKPERIGKTLVIRS